jgi:hypothetical protein
MWKAHAKDLDNVQGESVKYPSGESAPTDAMIEELKEKISRLLPE